VLAGSSSRRQCSAGQVAAPEPLRMPAARKLGQKHSLVNGLGGLAGRHPQRYDDEYDRSSIIRILLQAVFPRPHSPSPSPAAPVTTPLPASPRSNLALPLFSPTLPPHSLSPCQTGSQYGSNTEFVAEHGRDWGAGVVREAEWVTKRSPRHLLFKAFSPPINIDVVIEWEGRCGRY
jgi:hypothetical protein